MLFGEGVEMSARQLKEYKNLVRIGSKLGREELAKRAIAIAKQIVEADSYKNAIAGCGRMAILATACSFDEYWSEKRNIGKVAEYEQLESWVRHNRWFDFIKEVD